jgi:hypothetical protein
MPWDRDNSFAIRHHDVLTLSCDPKPGLFKRFNSGKMIDTGQFRELNCDLHFPDIGIFQLFVQNAQILFDRVFNILQSFNFRFAL